MDPTVEPEHTHLNGAPLTLDQQVADLSNQLRTAQAEIGQIQLDREEKKMPWWRQTAIIISVAGLLLSSGFSFYTMRDQNRQRKVTALESSLADLVALRMENARQTASLASTNQPAYRMWTTVASVRNAMLIDAAVTAVHNLDDDISPAMAFALSSELIQVGRYSEAEKMVKTGLKAAHAAQPSTGSLKSILAQVYIVQGNASLTREGRNLYNQAIQESFPNVADYASVSGKLNMILFWASTEGGLGNPKESAQLIQLARETLAAFPAPAFSKKPMADMIEAVANPLQQANTISLYDPSRLLGRWRISGSDNGNRESSLIINATPGYALPTFVRHHIDATVLKNLINGTILVTDPNNMRLEWNMNALALSPGEVRLGGYSDVTAFGRDPGWGRLSAWLSSPKMDRNENSANKMSPGNSSPNRARGANPTAVLLYPEG